VTIEERAKKLLAYLDELPIGELTRGEFHAAILAREVLLETAEKRKNPVQEISR